MRQRKNRIIVILVIYLAIFTVSCGQNNNVDNRDYQKKVQAPFGKIVFFKFGKGRFFLHILGHSFLKKQGAALPLPEKLTLHLPGQIRFAAVRHTHSDPFHPMSADSCPIRPKNDFL